MTQAAGTTTKILTMLPRAAEAFRTAITEGLDGKHPEAAARARLLLRELIGPVTIKTEPSGEVWGEFETRPAALFRGVADTDGRGEAICRVHAEVCSYSFVRTTHWKPLREALQRWGHAVNTASRTNTRRARRDE